MVYIRFKRNNKKFFSIQIKSIFQLIYQSIASTEKVMNLIAICLLLGTALAMISADDHNEPRFDNQGINARISAMAMQLGTSDDSKENDSELYRYPGSYWPAWPEPQPTQLGYTAVQQLVLGTCQTANLFVPLIKSLINRFQSCAGLVGPEAYLGKFWVQFLGFENSPIKDLLLCVENMRDEICTIANNMGIGTIVGGK